MQLDSAREGAMRMTEVRKAFDQAVAYGLHKRVGLRRY
jgi:hypothetical protein